MADRYFVNGGVDNNWGTTGNWSGASGGAGGAGVPTTLDNVFFNGSSPNCTINAGATRNCINLDCTGYINTLTFNATLNVTGNVSLGTSSMSMTGSSTFALAPVTSRTYSSGGCTCSVPMSITRSTGSTTIIWGSNWIQTGVFTLSGTTIWTWTGNTVTFKNSVAWNSTSVSGTTNVVFGPDISTTMNVTSTGSPNWSIPITINGAGTINLNLSFGKTGAFTYTAGSVNHTGTITFNSGSSTMNTSGMSFQNAISSSLATSTITLTSDLTLTGNYTYTSSATSFNPAGRTVFVGGNLTIGVGSSNITAPSGASTIVLNGSGTISGSAPSAMSLPLVINTTGTYSFFSGTILWLRNLTFISGTIVSTGNTISSNSASSFTINGTGFNIGTFTTSSSPTFTGTWGCAFGIYTCTTAGTTHTFQSGNTYTILNSLNLLGTAASALAFRSGTASSAAIINLEYGATLDVGHVTATDVNSSGGQTIWNYKGTLTRTTNWQLLPTIPKTIGKTWVS